MEVTPEMRAAVYEQDCRDRGHLPSLDNALRFIANAGGAQIAGPEGQQAHVTCRRCGEVWLIVEEPGQDYAAATVSFDTKLQAEHRPVRTKPPLPADPPVTPPLPTLPR